ncbi:multidrug transporter subunit MdtN [Scandinavium sp. H11S7]|uniref:multidrug transporter subunit MdtN n=1 Tax=Scandinavium hiltneri TaxID=2926519 RepID=UPI002165A4C3|nr:multidrug transporter subunit MdtN [Scandinavium hiltneri]MCS2155811.1 multidrug transporter subunit MdtN [Scandinavium hiltneri]
MFKNKQKTTLIVLTVAALIVLALVVWRIDARPRTDDAYAWADTITVSPEVSGRILEQPVRDNQLVQKDALLFRIDPATYEAALKQAQAKLAGLNRQIELTQRSVNAQKFSAGSAKASIASAQADAKKAADTLRRLAPLLSQGFASAEEVDQARAANASAQSRLQSLQLQAKQAEAAVSGVDALVAQRAEIEAQIDIAKLNLAHTEVRAPFTGRVASLKTSIGEFVSAGKPVFTLIDTTHWYVIANFRETELKNIQEGTPARVWLMSDTGKTFDGQVDSISYGVLPDDGGSIIAGLPAVKRNINWVHVSQRFPVKIRVTNPDPHLFRVGASAVATLQPR